MLTQFMNGTLATATEPTIAAISTPLGEGALAVVRLSGSEALRIADTVFFPVGSHSLYPTSAPSHTVQYGRVSRAGQLLDEVLLSVFRAPRTFTREDVVEISCHGGLLTAKLVLDALLEAGARLAEPGEFTKRAFLNGRIDLAQAEAVADLIHARTELALTAAHHQLAGRLSGRINQLRDDMLQCLAHVEAHIDFPDEDISPDNKEKLLHRLCHAMAQIEQLLRTAQEGQLLRRGVRAAIIGAPNVGKSSLLNLLLGKDRAIVSPIPGTTRDTIEETANVRGLPIVFIDTAGLRDADDTIEREGVRRSQETIDRAELVLHVLDRSQSLTAADEQRLHSLASKKRIVVLNKSDLPDRLVVPKIEKTPSVTLSCVTGEGLETLKDAIRALVWNGEAGSEMLEVMINSRHQDALRRAQAAALLSQESLQARASLELVAVDLRIAVNAVGEVVGKTSTEDLLDSIFRQFCIGK
jgi:tRNA modification GTPase